MGGQAALQPYMTHNLPGPSWKSRAMCVTCIESTVHYTNKGTVALNVGQAYFEDKMLVNLC